MRKVTPIAVNPSVDLASVAEQYYDRMPRFMSYMMEGLGSKRAESADLGTAADDGGRRWVYRGR